MTYALSKVPLCKASATGNDFLLVDLTSAERLAVWRADFGGRERAALAKAWCNRHEGLGADGMVWLEADAKLDFAWDFFNSDGGGAEMCGNAARAVALYMYEVHGKSQMQFATRIGPVRAQVHSPREIEVTLAPVVDFEMGLTDADTRFDFVRAGVPHAVVRVDSVQPIASLRECAARLKRQARFQKDGVNVTFMQTLSENKIATITFERGVEDFTLSCGTGAIAAAYVATQGAEGRALQVEVPGGRLSVVWKDNRPHLSGPAKIVAEMRVRREDK